MLKTYILDMHLEITNLWYELRFTGANEFQTMVVDSTK